MRATPTDSLERRVLILGPTRRDSETTLRLLEREHIQGAVCSDLLALCAECERGAAAALLPAESVLSNSQRSLAAVLERQPAWSDLPVIVLTPPDLYQDRVWTALRNVGHTTLLRRPVDIAGLISTIKAALRDRVRQYALRDHILDRERNEKLLREGDRRKNEFLAMLAHELRNPLAPIRNAVDVLNHMGDTSDQAAEMQAVIDRQVTHLARLVDDLLDVSRITSNRIRFQTRPVNLGEIVRAVAQDYEPQLAAKGCHFQFRVSTEALWAQGDAVRLTQAIGNVVHNATKFTDRGGSVTLVLERLSAGRARVAVADTGIGIEPETLRHVFEPFVQGGQSLDRSRGGLGLGLALVHGLIKLHGGDVSITSPGVGQGAAVTIDLPIVAPPVEKPSRTNADPGAGSCCRVMVVEDNLDAARTMHLLLERSGHQVKVANDGEEAIRNASQFQPAVVLCDIGLPGKRDGYAVATALRQNPATKSAYLVALTGYGQCDDQRKALDAGFDHHLTKPVDYHVLQKILQEHASVGCRLES